MIRPRPMRAVLDVGQVPSDATAGMLSELGFATLVGVVILVVPFVLEVLHELPRPLVAASTVLVIQAIHRLPQRPVRKRIARVSAGVR